MNIQYSSLPEKLEFIPNYVFQYGRFKSSHNSLCRVHPGVHLFPHKVKYLFKVATEVPTRRRRTTVSSYQKPFMLKRLLNYKNTKIKQIHLKNYRMTFKTADFNYDAVEFKPLRTIKTTCNQDEFSSKFKTSICKNWLSGKCDFGDQCTFAHGEHQLLKKPKLIPCKTYSRYGRCPFGKKCHFQHLDTVETSSEGSYDVPSPSSPNFEKEPEVERLPQPQLEAHPGEERPIYDPEEENKLRIIPMVPSCVRVRPVKRRLPVFVAIEAKGLQELVEKIKCNHT